MSDGWYELTRQDLDRLADDGCPHFTPRVEEVPTSGVIEVFPGQPGWLDYGSGQYRVFSCERCGWFVWHPIHYCHKCGGRMRMLKGRTPTLQAHVKKNNFEDGGF